MAEDDREGWRLLTEALGDRVQLVGDDVFVTSTAILDRGIAEEIANAVLAKLSEVGTVSETMDAIELARHAGYRTVVSHRSGETEDVCIADGTVGLGCSQLMCGAPYRSERVACYNRHLRIEAARRRTRAAASSAGAARSASPQPDGPGRPARTAERLPAARARLADVARWR